MPERRFFSCREIAEYLGISEKTVRRLIDRGEIPATKLGGKVLIDLKRLEEILEERKICNKWIDRK